MLPTIQQQPAKWGCYHGCVVNEEIALHERHLLDTPSTTSHALRVMKRLLYRKMNLYRVKTPTWEPNEVLKHKDGFLKRRYQRAYDMNNKWGLQLNKTSRVSMFLKHDKDPEHTIMDKVPRCVQHRDPRYVAELARYLLPIEQYVFKKWKPQQRAETAIFAKTLDTFGRAKRLDNMRKWGNDTIYIELDHSRWDAHQTPPLLKLEHDVYTTLNPSTTLKELLSRQIFNRCTSKNGLKYFSFGKRMSGDLNTGLGNSIVNYAVLLYATRYIRTAEIFLDGDDSVIAINRADLPKFDWDFTQQGQTTKVEKQQHELERASFCQSNPVKTPAGWRMVRTPWRAITRASYTTHQYRSTGWYRYLKSLGDCELACNRGVPILQQFALALIRASNGFKALPVESLPYELRVRMNRERDPGPLPITDEARFTFQRAFDISPDEQRHWERFFEEWDLTEHTTELVGLRDDQVQKYLVHPVERLAAVNPYAKLLPTQETATTNE